MLFYIIYKYKILGFIVFSLFISLSFFFMGMVSELKITINEGFLSIFIFGFLLFFLSIMMLIKKIKENYYNLKLQGIKEYSLATKRSLLIFIDIMFVLFFAAFLIYTNHNADNLQNLTVVIAVEVIMIFVMINLFFKFFITTILMHKNYDKVDHLFLKLNDITTKNNNFIVDKKNIKIKNRNDLLLLFSPKEKNLNNNSNEAKKNIILPIKKKVNVQKKNNEK